MRRWGVLQKGLPLSPPVNLPLMVKKLNETILDPLGEYWIPMKFRDSYIPQKPRGGTTERWMYVKSLYRSGYGRVYLEQESSTKSLRVVRVLRRGIMDRIFKQELEAHLALRGESNLFVQFHGWYLDIDSIYLTTEYFCNGTLAQYLENFALEAKWNAREITTQLLTALEFMHRKRICHRDVKPENVFISCLSPIHVKLGEFGISIDTCVTAVETAGYQSHEILHLQLRPLDSAYVTDIWALGCILFQIFVPFGLLVGGCNSDSAAGAGIETEMSDPQIDMKQYYEYCRRRVDLPIETLRGSGMSENAIDLAKKLLAAEPRNRFFAAEALTHPWITAPTIGNQCELDFTAQSPGVHEYSGSIWRDTRGVTQGAMGAALLQVSNISGELRVVKKVHLDKYKLYSMAYRRELGVLVSLDSSRENFVRFLGWHYLDNQIHFLMEYAGFGDLAQYLGGYDRGESPNVAEISREVKSDVGDIISQLLEGLIFLSEEGICYPDLKPTNVLVFSRSPIRVKFLLVGLEGRPTDLHAYTAPELLGLLPPTSDLPPLSTKSANMWFLGCLIHKILTSRDLFSEDDSFLSTRDIIPRLDSNKLKQYCCGEIELPTSTLEPSPMNKRWLLFMKDLLVAHPSSRKTARQSRESVLIRIIKSINPLRWRVIFRDELVVQQANEEITTWKEFKNLHCGNMGSVSLMKEQDDENLDAGRVVATKRVPKDLFTKHRIDYYRELITLVELRNDIDLFVQFLGWYEDRHAIYLVMEYIEAGDLARYLEEFPVDAKSNAKEISTQLLEGVAFLHERKICHRDLKPQNILVVLRSPVRVKLADFGLSKSTSDSKLLTKCGTRCFEAPELLESLPPRLRPRRHAEYTIAVDSWALGCLIHKILTLETPFMERIECSSESGCVGNDGRYETQFDFNRLKDFCYGKVEFPRDSLLEAEVCRNGINFIEKLLVPDPNNRMSATEALKHPWLTIPAQGYGSLDVRNADIFRNQLSSLGVHISQKTADYLMMQREGLRGPGTNCYLPSSIVTNIQALQYKASSAGFTFLLKILLSIRLSSNPESPSIPTWSLDPPYPDGRADKIDSCGGATLLQAAVTSQNIETIRLILLMGQDVNKVAAETDRTALQVAAATGCPEVVTLLLDNGATVNAGPSDPDGRTALQAAAEDGHLHLVELLLKRGANCNAQPSDQNGRTALQAAAEGGHIEIVRELLQNKALINADPCSVQGRTALQGAAGAGHFELVSFLLKQGADVNSQPSEVEGRTALQAAAEEGHLQISQLLLNRHADVNATAAPNYGRTALQAAAATANIELVELLLASNAEINAPPCNIGGRTALQASAESGHFGVFSLLLKHGADINAGACEAFGRTALQGAAEAGHVDIISKLLEDGADIEADPSEVSGRTALQAAAEGGYLEVVEVLLNHDAEIEAKPCEADGRTALQAAAQCGHLDIVKLLLERDADPNASPGPHGGRTALHAAAENGHLGVVRLLLEYNADPQYSGNLARASALENGHTEVAELIASMSETLEAINYEDIFLDD